MNWVLIILFNGVSVNSAYFSSEDLCKKAKAEIEKTENGLLKRASIYCVKGK